MTFITVIVHSHMFHGAVAGFLVAAHVDYQAFKSWKSAHDAATYDWPTAILRWAQGAVTGAVTAAIAGGAAPDIATFGA